MSHTEHMRILHWVKEELRKPFVDRNRETLEEYTSRLIRENQPTYTDDVELQQTDHLVACESTVVHQDDFIAFLDNMGRKVPAYMMRRA